MKHMSLGGHSRSHLYQEVGAMGSFLLVRCIGRTIFWFYIFNILFHCPLSWLQCPRKAGDSEVRLHLPDWYLCQRAAQKSPLGPGVLVASPDAVFSIQCVLWSLAVEQGFEWQEGEQLWPGL